MGEVGTLQPKRVTSCPSIGVPFFMVPKMVICLTLDEYAMMTLQLSA